MIVRKYSGWLLLLGIIALVITAAHNDLKTEGVLVTAVVPASSFTISEKPLIVKPTAKEPQPVLVDHVKSIPILMYHKVGSDPRTGSVGHRIEPENFDWQMRYLKEQGYHTVDLGAVVDHFQKGVPIPEKPIVITLDDGYEDNYQYAIPILKKYGFTATIFVVSNTIGGVNEFDIKAKLQPRTPMLTWEQIREIDAAGFTIGCHTLDHAHLSKVSQEEARRQIMEAKKALEAGLKKEVRDFCYPYGEYNRAVINIVREGGFRAATTVNPEPVRSVKDPLLLNRIGIPGYLDPEEFINKLPRN